MFSPECLNEERGECFLVANHCQACSESIQSVILVVQLLIKLTSKSPLRDTALKHTKYG